MSTNENGVSKVTTVTTVSTDPVAEPAGNYVATAQERILELQRWREQIPHFVIPAGPESTRRLTSAAAVPPVFVELTNVAVANQGMLVRKEAATPAQLRGLMSFSDAYNPLADELEALAHFVRHSAATARNAAGTEALTTYALAQRLAKLPQYAHLKPYVADMRRALGRGRKLTPEEAAQKASDRAAKAAAKLAKKAAKLLPPALAGTTPQSK